MRNVFHKSCRETQNTHFTFNNLFWKSCRLWDNVKKWITAVQATDGNMAMRIACWIPKSGDTHSEYVIFIAFPPQQWLHQRASLLCYTCISWLLITWTECLLRGTNWTFKTFEVRFRLLSFNIFLGWEERHRSAQYIPGSCICVALQDELQSCGDTQWHALHTRMFVRGVIDK